MEQLLCHGRCFRGPQGLSCADESGAPRWVQNQVLTLKKKARMVLVGKKPRSTKQKGLWSPAWRCRQPEFSPSLPLNVEESSFSSPFLCRSDAFGHQAAFLGLLGFGAWFDTEQHPAGTSAAGHEPRFSPPRLPLCDFRNPSSEYFLSPRLKLRVLVAALSVRLAPVPYCTSGPHLELKGSACLLLGNRWHVGALSFCASPRA